MRKKILVLLAPFVIAIFAQIVAAATSSTTEVGLAGLGRVHLTCQGRSGSTVSVTGVDTSDSSVKKAIVQKVTVNGQEVQILVRLHKTTNGLFVDLVADASVGSLTETVTALSLSTVTIGHPAPAKDLIDTTAMTAAGGS